MPSMNTLLTSIELPPGRAVTVPAQSGHLLRVTHGRVWLTRTGDPDDHFVDAGERMPLHDAGGPVVIEAVGGAACCRLEPDVGAVHDAPVLAA
jgi:hypothetical protein